MSTQVRQVNGRVIHLCAGERWARARGIGNGEGVLGEGVQDSTGVVKEIESLVAGVTVVVTFRFSNPSTSVLGVEILTVKSGVAKTTAEAARTAREGKSIAARAVREGDLTENLAVERAWLKLPSGPRG